MPSLLSTLGCKASPVIPSPIGERTLWSDILLLAQLSGFQLESASLTRATFHNREEERRVYVKLTPTGWKMDRRSEFLPF